MMEETAQERQTRARPLAAARQIITLSLPQPTSAIPGLRPDKLSPSPSLSSGSSWGTPGPRGAGVEGESGYDKGDISWLAEMISRHVFCRGQQYGVYRDIYICR